MYVIKQTPVLNYIFILDTKLADTVIVILSQPNSYHAGRARLVLIDLMKQMKTMNNEDKPAVFMTHRKWPILGAWTIFPLLEKYSYYLSL